MDPNAKSDFSKKMKIYMKFKDLTNSDISRLTKIDRSLTAKYINGVKIPKRTTIIKIAEAINVNANWLLGDPNADIIDDYSLDLKQGTDSKVEHVFGTKDNNIPQSAVYDVMSNISKILTTAFRTDEKYATQYYTLLMQVRKLNSEGIKDLIIKAYSLLEDNSLIIKASERKLLNTTIEQDYQYLKIINSLNNLVKGDENGSTTGREEQKMDDFNNVLQGKKNTPHK
jgi:transcriptional regulator with XRE-family HTH domain